MFDDPKLQKQPAKFVPPAAGPSESVPNVEDIFAKTAPSAPAAPNIQSAALPTAGSALGGAMSKAPLPAPVASKKGIFIALAIIVVVAVLAAAGWFVYDMIVTGKSINKGIETLKQTPPATEIPPVAGPTVPAPEALPVVEPEKSIVDSDSDGLTDSEELTYGTNPQKADTDDDGLTDKEEVKIYQTDPLNADTDGDSFVDGMEVKNGYNPSGAGKLLDFEKAKKVLQGVE